jgi:hypothetical protein
MNGLLDVYLSDLNKKSGFAYPKKYVEGGPLPPQGRDVGDHVTSFIIGTTSRSSGANLGKT